MSAGRVVLLVFGILILLLSLGMLFTGGAILAFDSSFKDSQGFYNTEMIPVVADASAVITRPADFQANPVTFLRQGNPLTIKVVAGNTDPSKAVFIGIARTTDLDRYLTGVDYDEFTGFGLRSNSLDLLNHPGSARPAPPIQQSFWVTSSSGTGQRELLWDVTSGSYSLVLMNADGSSPVDADISLGARIPGVVHGLGLGILIAGIVVLVIGGLMVFFAVRGWGQRPAQPLNPQ